VTVARSGITFETVPPSINVTLTVVSFAASASELTCNI
jgi:hypothetical protein